MDSCESIHEALRDTKLVLGCEPIKGGAQLVTLSHHFADGDLIELVVTIKGQAALISDFGSALTRVSEVGLSLTSRRVDDALRYLVKGYGVDELNGELRLEVPLSRLGEGVIAMTGAVLQVDALRTHQSEPRRRRFESRLLDWLQEQPALDVTPHPRLHGTSGRDYRVTAGVGTQQVVYVQAVTASPNGLDERSVEHTYTLFSDVNGHVPPHMKVAVLGETVDRFEATEVALLQKVCRVAAWWERPTLTDYLLSPSASIGSRLFTEPVELITGL